MAGQCDPRRHAMLLLLHTAFICLPLFFFFAKKSKARGSTGIGRNQIAPPRQNRRREVEDTYSRVGRRCGRSELNWRGGGRGVAWGGLARPGVGLQLHGACNLKAGRVTQW